jgi:hypothetical protein
MDQRKLNGSSLEQALSDGSLETRSAGGASLVCMVKKSDKHAHVSITAAGCQEWIDLPSDLIEEAEVIGRRQCKDHEHPLVRISLKPPTTEEGKTLSILLRQFAGSRLTNAGERGGVGAIARQRGPGGIGAGGVSGAIGCDIGCFLDFFRCEADPFICQEALKICLFGCNFPEPVF